MTTSDDLASETLVGLPRGDEALPGLPLRRPAWERRYRLWLPVTDAAVLLGALVSVHLVSWTLLGGRLPSNAAAVVQVAGVGAWVGALSLQGSYTPRFLGQGPEEYQRIAAATWNLVALVAVGSYALETARSPGLLLAVAATGALGVFVSHHVFRRALWLQRQRGQCLHRLLVVGPARPAGDLVEHIAGTASPFQVVGTCVTGLISDEGEAVAQLFAPYDVQEVIAAIRRSEAETVTLVGSAAVDEVFVRSLRWHLRGSSIDLLVPVSSRGLPGARVRVRPVDGLGLHFVRSGPPRGLGRVLKAAVDVTLSALLLILLAPLFALIALAIKATSRGPVIFRQRRVGLNGDYFRIWKFRTMRDGADDLGDSDLATELAGGRGKLVDDPRVTRIGRLLRRTSLDELPQIVNVLLGHMSLVGPRPVPADLESFADHELRRLAVKPGMTGLWQVSGRSELSWPERVHLDTYYVENWTPLLDLVILFRTVSVVLRGNGAY